MTYKQQLEYEEILYWIRFNEAIAARVEETK